MLISPCSLLAVVAATAIPPMVVWLALLLLWPVAGGWFP